MATTELSLSLITVPEMDPPVDNEKLVPLVVTPLVTVTLTAESRSEVLL